MTILENVLIRFNSESERVERRAGDGTRLALLSIKMGSRGKQSAKIIPTNTSRTQKSDRYIVTFEMDHLIFKLVPLQLTHCISFINLFTNRDVRMTL